MQHSHSHKHLPLAVGFGARQRTKSLDTFKSSPNRHRGFEEFRKTKEHKEGSKLLGFGEKARNIGRMMDNLSTSLVEFKLFSSVSSSASTSK